MKFRLSKWADSSHERTYIGARWTLHCDYLFHKAPRFEIWPVYEENCVMLCETLEGISGNPITNCFAGDKWRWQFNADEDCAYPLFGLTEVELTGNGPDYTIQLPPLFKLNWSATQGLKRQVPEQIQEDLGKRVGSFVEYHPNMNAEGAQSDLMAFLRGIPDTVRERLSPEQWQEAMVSLRKA